MIRRVVAQGMLAGMLLSPKLWLSSRLYPLTPVAAFLHPIPPPWDHVIYGAMLALLVCIAIWPTPRRPIVAFLALAVAYSLWDQSRWQPWFYQYLAMLAALLLLHPWRACRIIVASIYVWSGIHKLNPGFIHDTFPWMLASFTTRFDWLAYAVPFAEAAIGIGLAVHRLRRPAILAAVAMHAFILAAIGPLTRNYDSVIWPWNVAMAVLVVLLFWQDTKPHPSAPADLAALALFGFLPVLSLVNLWDSYPAFSLYSGKNRTAKIYMADAVADTLPEAVQESISVNDSGVDELDIFEWSFAELNVPPYPEVRVFRNVGTHVCAMAGNPSQMVLFVRNRGRALTFDCGRLNRR